MPLHLGDYAAVLEGDVTVEDAEPLAAWLRSTSAPQVDLAGCTHLHAAAFQALVAARVKVISEPSDVFLRTWITPALHALSDSDEPTTSDDEDDR